jgi:hypothetical protein
MREEKARQTLLEDVFSSGEVEALRRSIRAACSRELSLKRRSRAGRWILLAAAATLLAVAVRFFFATGGAPIETPFGARPAPAYFVATRPLPDAARARASAEGASPFEVHTDLSIPGCVVQTTRFTQVVKTEPLDPALLLTDTQLLALFGDVPCGLTKDAEGKAHFFFLRPEDESRFLQSRGG